MRYSATLQRKSSDSSLSRLVTTRTTLTTEVNDVQGHQLLVQSKADVHA